jgi:protein-glutamine gamma-glutamyltransferase
LTMPGRKSVPEYTIVRYINHEIDLQSIKQINRAPIAKKLTRHDRDTTGQKLAAETVRAWTAASTANMSPWDKVNHVMEYLRHEFRLDRSFDTSSSTDPLADFFQHRAGSDLMFASAASCMLRELGYDTRLVTGFVARRQNRQGWSKEFAIYAEDTHAWLEVDLGAGQWIPLEPTPGYPLPVFRITWRYWLVMHFWKLVTAV